VPYMQTSNMCNYSTYIILLQPNATLLKSSIIDAKQLCLPLEDAIQSAVLSESFVDMKTVLSEELTLSREDLAILMKNILVVQLQRRNDNLHAEFCKGLSVVQGGIALFFSAPMVDQARKLVPALIEERAKCRAHEAIGQEVTEQFLVPLLDMAKCISDVFPDLSDIQQHFEITHGKSSFTTQDDLQWSSENESDDGPLIEFCRHTVDLASMKDMCQRAIKAEMIAIQHKISASSILEGASGIQNKEEAFEISFREMSYLLQLFSKGIHALEVKIQAENISEIIDTMKTELLLSCGSCLAKRITEYCMFKHGVTDDQKDTVMFSCSESGVPHREHGFYIPVDLGTLAFPHIRLDCKAEKDGKILEPSEYLKMLLPPSIGGNLAKMWSFCSDVDARRDGQHTLDIFIEYLNETCFSLVGIPFSTLDKKNEKRVLASRRQCIADLLLYTPEKEQVMFCATAFLFQLSKASSIVGKRTLNLVLNTVLGEDKKIPQAVTQSLLKLKEGDADDDLIAEVKKLGTAKNVKSLTTIITE
jgi:hypothetical protein